MQEETVSTLLYHLVTTALGVLWLVEILTLCPLLYTLMRGYLLGVGGPLHSENTKSLNAAFCLTLSQRKGQLWLFHVV